MDIGSPEVLVPELDLRGIDWKEEELQRIVCPFAHLEWARLRKARLEGSDLRQAHLEEAYLYRAHLEGSVLREARLEGSDLRNAHIEEANLLNAHLEGANLDGAHLEEVNLCEGHLEAAELYEVHLEGAILREVHLEGAILWKARLEGTNLRVAHLEEAYLMETHLEGADLSFVSVGKIEKLSEDCNLSSDRLEELSGKPTTFDSTEFLPKWRDLLLPRPQLKKMIRLNFNRWFYTDFTSVRIDDADTVQAGDLYRYVKDQQFLYRFKDRHPIIYWLWKIFTDCGGSMAVVAFWAFLIIWAFAGIYANAPFETPQWLLTFIPDFLIVNTGEGLIQQDKLMNVSPIFRWFFVSFDVFTNLGIRNMNPLNDAGVVVVFFETVMGYVTLGMLISVLTSKYARRS